VSEVDEEKSLFTGGGEGDARMEVEMEVRSGRASLPH